MPRKLKYVLPKYLESIFTQKNYSALVEQKAGSLRDEDRRRKLPCFFRYAKRDYALAIHTAFQNCDGKDPFTGESLRWDLLHKYFKTKIQKLMLLKTPLGATVRERALLPSIDHKDPQALVLDFEICSLRVNSSKSYMTPAEYIALCKMVVANSG
ncbi:MAG: hypothetical protein PHC61_17480 [Chitinivibrionales bacterium]|nr:hypothetical protein [Chitinivibrionales bacterium]